MRCGENNHNVHDVHDGYEEEMAPSSDVNNTDEDESNNSIVHEPFHKPSSENICMDISESECNSDVPTNVITELKYDEHIEPSLSVKGKSYFNIFECSRNLLDQLDVTYQRAFTASAKPPSIPKGHYEPSPARERLYNLFKDDILDTTTSPRSSLSNDTESCDDWVHVGGSIYLMTISFAKVRSFD